MFDVLPHQRLCHTERNGTFLQKSFKIREPSAGSGRLPSINSRRPRTRTHAREEEAQGMMARIDVIFRDYWTPASAQALRRRRALAGYFPRE
jgi:hypothetical protein